VELNEALRRIFGQHWIVIALMLVAGTAVAAFMSLGSGPSYTASTRLVLDTQDPTTSTGSSVIGDTARAIATSPSDIAAALKQAGVTDRNPAAVANHVSAGPLGASGVLQLSVTDRSPRVAEALANALAARVIATRTTVDGTRIGQISSDLDSRIASLNRRIANADSTIDRLNQRLALGATGPTAARLRLQADAESRLRDFDAQQRGVLVSERLGLLSTDALRPQAAVISPATLPRHPDASSAPPDIALGALLGLVLGVGTAALIETLRPKLQGGDVLAQELGTSHLGTIPADPADVPAGWSPERLALVLRLAAEGAGVRNVSLLSAEPDTELGPIARQIESALNESSRPNVVEAAPSYSVHGGGAADPTDRADEAAVGQAAGGVQIRPFGTDYPFSANGAGTGVAVVAPLLLRRSQIVKLNHLLRVLPAPVLGLITYRPSRPPWMRFLRRPGARGPWDQPSESS
jgi:capsular polysaccharide biosynthesis protein